MPSYAPDHNPTEHVWNAAKNNIANLQRDIPENTFAAFTAYITNRTFDLIEIGRASCRERV